LLITLDFIRGVAHMGMQKRDAARGPKPDSWQLARRHNRQIGRRPETDWAEMSDLAAITFRPGDSTSTFTDKTLRPLGTAVTVVVTYENGGAELSISGYRARLGTHGLTSYGRDGDREFCHDGRQPLNGRGLPSRLSAKYNPTLVELLLRADVACWQSRGNQRKLPATPQMPRILLGFSPQQPPEFEITPALRLLAARKAGIRLQKLDSNPELLVDRLLQDTWEEQLSFPGSAGNPTDLLLVDADICTQAHRALRAFEDFRRLIGANTWNPSRAVDILRAPNPAGVVLERYSIDPSVGFDQPIPFEVVDQMENEMRHALGDLAPQFSQEDLLDGLTESFQQVIACTCAIGAMRSMLTPYWSECSTDADLRMAARDRDAALHASGVARVQILHRCSPDQPLQYGPDELQRRMEIDWKPVPWTREVVEATCPESELAVA
jgi:hypothetical protein